MAVTGVELASLVSVADCVLGAERTRGSSAVVCMKVGLKPLTVGWGGVVAVEDVEAD